LSPRCADRNDDDCTAPLGEDEQVLYVADSLKNRIAEIPDALTRTTSAGTGKTLSTGGNLNDPLGLAVALNGHLLVVNGNDGSITEITSQGAQIAKKLLDNTGGPPPGTGTLFGVVFDPEQGVVFVDDGSNTLNVLR
jgi:sugar lactone lactonase YvrE